MLTMRLISSLLPACIMTIGASVALSQDYPSKTIRIVTSAVGGGGDRDSRLIAQGISPSMGQPVIVDNRAGGTVAAEVVSKAPPDGYTVFVGGASIWIAPLFQPAPYDIRDFAPISLTSRQVFAVIVHPSLPVKSVKDLIALAKAKPGVLNYASGVSGGPAHLSVELFKSMAAVNIVRVTYKGNAAAATGLISGEVQMTINDWSLAAPHVKAGKLRALAVSSAEPSALAPGLPTVAASGVPGYESVGMTAIMAPAKTPTAVLNRLNQEVVRFLSNPEVKQRYLNGGEEIVANSPEALAAIIKADLAKWGKLIKDAGLKAD